MEQTRIYCRCDCISCRMLPFEDRPWLDTLWFDLVHKDNAENILKEYIKKNRKVKTSGNTYFCTLTTLPGFKDYKLWLQAIYKVLTRKFVLSFTIAAEHLDTNLHCHILIKAKQQVQKKHFHSYCKATGATIIDVRKVTEDNGIEDYMELENPTFNNFSEFQNFILTHFNAL